MFGFDGLGVPAWVLELDGAVVATNLAARELIGHRDDHPRRTVSQLAPELGMKWLELVEAARLHGQAVEEAPIDTPLGSRTLHVVLSLHDAGERTLAQLIAIDITARKTEEQQASKQRLESLGLVAGGIAHDFNNLLVGVLAEASAAREDRGLSENTREALRRIEAAARRMAQLTRQLLAYSGRGQFVTMPVDPDELIMELRDPLARIVRPEAQLHVAPGAGALVVEADPSLLRQVVFNLVANASDANGTRVAVATCVIVREGNPWWQLEVTDDGCGIESDKLGHIFEPFFSTKPDRHGLGLSAVHGIVRRLGGDVEVDSRPNQGSRFRVRLPIVPGEKPKVPVRASTDLVGMPALKLANMRVLVADDEPSVRATVRRLLERRGATVVVAADGVEAEARLQDEKFGLVVTDISMPGRSGHDVLVTARATQPNTPVVLMSGYTERIRGEGSEEEADAFLEKPFTARTLDQVIDEVLKKAT